jgi:signal transduction histidine kinase
MTGRFRSSFMVLLLVVALLLTGVLAFQAYRAEEYHQETAGSILQDYAELAVEELSARVTQQLDYYGATPLLSYLGQSVSEPRAPLPTLVDAAERSRLRQPLALVSAFFSIDLAGSDGTDGLRVEGTLDPGMRDWVADTVLADLAATADEEWRFRTLFGPAGKGGLVVIYATVQDGERPMGVVGFVSDREAVAGAVADAYNRGPVLPDALTRGRAADSTTAALVTGPDGEAIYRSPRYYASPYTASASVAPYLGGMTATVALDPDLTESLIIGGSPLRRLPLLIALFVLCAAMIAAAMMLWRREQTVARLRSDFVSGVSHELRTPLAQIRMFAETLKLGRVRNEDERDRSLAIIDHEARRLTHLVENLLYFSRGERRTQRVETHLADLSEVVSETVATFRPLAAARQCEVVLEALPGVMAAVDVDAVRQMLLNLLDNAIKYGPVGQEVRVTVTTVDGCGRVAVEDQGPGVPSSHRSNIWQRFWRAERHHASAIAGTGIGLAIVQELAALQDAEVWVENRDTGGARFVIAWPRNDAVDDTAADMSEPKRTPLNHPAVAE